MATGNYDFLKPLFEHAHTFAAGGVFRPLPSPEPGSSIASEDAKLGGFNTSMLLAGVMASGIEHIEILRILVMDQKVMHPYAAWSLLRVAQENFGLCVWLLFGKTRDERLARTIKLWFQDMKTRGQYDKETKWTPPAGGKTADERLDELKAIAVKLGLSVSETTGRLRTEQVLQEAAMAIGVDPVAMVANWRVASGFAHGRVWPKLRHLEATGAVPMKDGALIRFTMAERNLADLARACEVLLAGALARYKLRSKK